MSLPDEVRKTLKSQKDFFLSGKTQDISYRLHQLKKLAAVLNKAEPHILKSLYSDLRKPPFESYGTELGLILQEINLFIKNLKNWAKPQKVRTPFLYWPSKSEVHHSPYGQVLIISPWNYPLQLTLTPFVGAIAAGNVCVLKPSEKAPATSKLLSDLIQENFNDELVTVVLGGKDTSEQLLEHDFDFVFYTGSTPVGRKIAEKTARRLIPTILELGGKSPCIVDSTADIAVSARRTAWGKFLNSGQTCIAPDYVLVESSIKDEWLRQLTRSLEEFFTKHPQGSRSYGRIIDKSHFERLVNLIQSGRVVHGGRHDKNDLFMEPTIVTDVPTNSPLLSEEVFGPILPVMEFETRAEAIEIVRRNPDPLSLYVFSKSKEFQNYMINNLRFGGGCVNDTMIHFGNPELPFGGVGTSGIGRYTGKTSYLTFTYPKSIVRRPFKPDPSFRYPPYADRLKWLKGLMN